MADEYGRGIPATGEFPELKKVLDIYGTLAPRAEKHKGVVRDYYYVRLDAIPWRLVHSLIGAISSAARYQCIMEGVELVKGRVPYETIIAKRSEIAKAVFGEIRRHILETGKVPVVVVPKPVWKLVSLEVPAPVTRR